ncbi:MAG: S8 family peptidase [Paenibacillaceae bacterium]
MFRKWMTIAIIALLGLLILPVRHPSDEMKTVEKLTAQREIQLKQQTVTADVQITNDLCRSQCALDFHQTIKKLNQTNVQDQVEILQKMQKDHPHMAELVWSANPSQAKVFGSLNKNVRSCVQNELKIAKQSVTVHKEYHSPPIIVDGETYFVLGVPSATNPSSLIGVIHQKILSQVAQHQIKNLRVVPYPGDNHWKIESVDSKNLQDVNVDHPEDNEGTSHYHKNEVVVKFKQPPTENQLKQIQAEIHAKKVKKLGYTFIFQAETLDAKQLMSYFQKWDVVYSEPHFLYLTNEKVPATVNEPNDLLYSKYQWNLPIIKTEIGWDVGKGSENVIVAVVDTGADLNHPDLQGRLQTGYNVVDSQSPPMDDVGHGTHVAGIISALVNNGEGVAGMTWYNPVMPIKVLDETGAGNTYNVAQGIIWAADHGAKVINMSLGNYADANFLHDAIKYAYDKDIVLIAASGNDNTEEPGFPAAYPEVFAVAAADASKHKASFSNFGTYIDVTAPGVNIASTYPHNQYAALSGTSMASPHVTALAALIRSTNPQLKNTEVMEIMRKTAEDLGTPGKDKYYGYGQIDVVRALQAARGQSTFQTSTPKLNFWPEWLSRPFYQLKDTFSS